MSLCFLLEFSQSYCVQELASFILPPFQCGYVIYLKYH